jgi:hypothetical protein
VFIVEVLTLRGQVAERKRWGIGVAEPVAMSDSPCSHISSHRDSLAGAFKCYATQIAVIHYPTALL